MLLTNKYFAITHISSLHVVRCNTAPIQCFLSDKFLERKEGGGGGGKRTFFITIVKPSAPPPPPRCHSNNISFALEHPILFLVTATGPGY
ncbi:hypothetical protein CEXT_102371 [Caerostris extrusa]|uniref:Uncharacterized protein n=1 Tax=Caerostris extrusa TaxID=172846 RepID=A0AAV4N358_CAEEX|nr:hypothetical protein CEXT_102371 [Caerostris extrusa]